MGTKGWPDKNQSSDRTRSGDENINNGKQPDFSFIDARVHKGTPECGVPLEPELSCTRASIELVRPLVVTTITRMIF